MKIFLIFIAFIFAANGAPASVSNLEMAEWRLFKLEYGKSYKNDEEESFRLQVYLNNSRLINEHNKRHAEGKVSFQLGMNQFGDSLHHELKQMILMNLHTKEKGTSSEYCQTHTLIPSQKLSPTWDWRNWKGVVTPVRNQGSCGSCWAFAAVAALESEHYLRTKQRVSLSEQNLMDCTKHMDTAGCDGGSSDAAFEYVIQNKGIDTRYSYPYIGKDRDVCIYNASNSGDRINACRAIPKDDEVQLKIAIEKVGPVAVAIHASPVEFMYYKSGVMFSSYCASNPEATLDHEVLAIGFGTEDDHDYWLIKNSWGTTWGEEGFGKIARNVGSHCGIATEAVYPLFLRK